jgi:hypothetical protein
MVAFDPTDSKTSLADTLFSDVTYAICFGSIPGGMSANDNPCPKTSRAINSIVFTS